MNRNQQGKVRSLLQAFPLKLSKQQTEIAMRGRTTDFLQGGGGRSHQGNFHTVSNASHLRMSGGTFGTLQAIKFKSQACPRSVAEDVNIFMKLGSHKTVNRQIVQGVEGAFKKSVESFSLSTVNTHQRGQ